MVCNKCKLVLVSKVILNDLRFMFQHLTCYKCNIRLVSMIKYGYDLFSTYDF